MGLISADAASSTRTAQPKKCHFEDDNVLIPKGKVVVALAQQDSAEQKTWIRVDTGYVVEIDRKDSIPLVGWVNRQFIAYLTEFRKMPSWPKAQMFDAADGEYGVSYKVKKDATFVLDDFGYTCKKTKFCMWGAMYAFADIIWARPGKGSAGQDFFFVPDRPVYADAQLLRVSNTSPLDATVWSGRLSGNRFG